MTVHDKKPAAPVGSGAPIARLRIREAALRHQAAQLQARAEHLQRVAHSQAQRLQRRVDAHEKIVLGSLVKKAGLDFPLPQGQELQKRQGFLTHFVAAYIHDHKSGLAILGDEHGLAAFRKRRGHFGRVILEVTDRFDLG